MALQDLCHLQEVFPDTDCSPFGTRTGYYDGGFPASSSSHLFNFFIPAAEFLQESPLQFGQVSNASTSQDHLLSSLSWPPGLPQDSPQSVPLPFPMSHGTTTLAFLFQGGVLAAADTRSSCSGLVACPSSQKVLPIHSHLTAPSGSGSWLESSGSTNSDTADACPRRRRQTDVPHVAPVKGSELCVAVTLCGWDGGELDLNQKPTQGGARTGPSDPDSLEKASQSSIDARTGPSDPDSLEKASQSSTDARTGPSDPDSLEKASQSSIDARTGPSDPDSLEKSSQSSIDARTGPSDLTVLKSPLRARSMQELVLSSIDARTGPSDPDSLEKSSQSSIDARTGPSDPDSLEKASQSSIDARTGPSDPDSLEKSSQSLIDARTGPSDPDSLEKASQILIDARTGPSDPDSLEKSSQSSIDARTGPSDPDSLEKASQSSIDARTGPKLDRCKKLVLVILTVLKSPLRALIDARTDPSDPDSLEKSSQSSINAQQSFVRKRPSGPSLFYVCSDGTRLQGALFSVGSGSPYAYSILDQGVRWDLTLQEATSVAREAVYRATHRDAWSGNCVDVFHVSSAGWKRRGREDLREEYYRERERRGGRGPEGGYYREEGETRGVREEYYRERDEGET
ncbi:hypothetical protein F7725_027083 [Dissostichus mawsoni]|uniref:Uncharacterized protein n=1 Tax=Dissostichus mawsoni TaxID=36200 RepID=A0A7J5XBZ0_DISMA|nr:hypothetical protein F7725_027083 [Dissostichus mawsoni]